MKKIIFFLPLIMCLCMHGEQRVWLESSVIKIADGTFINANEVEFIRMFSRKLLGLLIGEQLPNKQRKGKYFLFGKWYAVDALARIEQEVKNSFTKKDFETKLALEELLTYAKADFIIQSGEFIENGRGAKSIMTVLIQESCQKRNRSESLLLEWAKTKEGQESTMFDRQVKSFSDYSGFLTDLVNFLSDLIYSCPKADVQFKARVAKWKAVKNLLPIVLKKAHVKGEQINEIEFLKYLKERYLDSIIIDEITPQVIVPLLTEYIKHTHA